MEGELHPLQAPDGRVLEVVSAGPEDGTVVLVHVGTPSAGRLFGPWARAGEERGLRHVTYSRPGYAGSTRRPGRTVADCVDDVVLIADALGFERFHTIGWSGGGPHALACAWLLGDRVMSAATLASVAPLDAEGLDWTAGMGDENVEEFGALKQGPEALRAFLETAAPAFRELTRDTVIEVFGDLLSDVDKSMLTGEFAEFIAEITREGLRESVDGWFDDDMAIARPWGFDLAAIAVPAFVWQGAQDRFVPYSHGEWLAAHVGSAVPRLFPDEGHLSIVVGKYARVLDELVAASG